MKADVAGGHGVREAGAAAQQQGQLGALAELVPDGAAAGHQSGLRKKVGREEQAKGGWRTWHIKDPAETEGVRNMDYPSGYRTPVYRQPVSYF